MLDSLRVSECRFLGGHAAVPACQSVESFQSVNKRGCTEKQPHVPQCMEQAHLAERNGQTWIEPNDEQNDTKIGKQVGVVGRALHELTPLSSSECTADGRFTHKDVCRPDKPPEIR